MKNVLSNMLLRFDAWGNRVGTDLLLKEEGGIERRSIQNNVGHYGWNWAILVAAAAALAVMYAIRDKGRSFKLWMTVGLGGMLLSMVAAGIYMQGHSIDLFSGSSAPEYNITQVEFISKTSELTTVEMTAGENEPDDAVAVAEETAQEQKEVTPEKEKPKKDDISEKADEELPDKETAHKEAAGTEITDEETADKAIENKEEAGQEKEEGESADEKGEEAPEQETPEKDVQKSGETVLISITSGMDSGAVAKLMEEKGLVESAIAFDRFLCDNGYDRKLRTGDFEIPAGAGEEELARILTTKG